MPRGETERDLQNEAEIVGFIISKYPKKYDGFIKIDRFGYNLDGALTKLHPFGYAEAQLFYEAKQRECPFRHYPDYMIGAGKLEQARKLTAASSLRSCLFVRFSDGVIASVDFAKHRGDFRVGGRTDRPEYVNDIERMAVFPWDDFAILNDSTRR